MGWRTLIIKDYDQIKLKNNNIVINKHDNFQDNNANSISYVLDDINAIIFENNFVLFSSKLMCELIKKDIFVIFTDDSHNPTGILLPLASHCMPLANLEMQLNLDETIKQKLWTKVICQKLINQKQVMLNLNISQEEIDKIKKLLKSFVFNDITNREGLVAKIYFRSLFGSAFIRFENDTVNSLLNYGYKIISSALSRTLVQFGFNLYLGFHHKSKQNPFNLTYDLIEPYRPLVDQWIINNWENLDFTNGISYNNRLGLIKLLNSYVMINNKIMSVLSSMNFYVRSFISALKFQDISKLKIPNMIDEINEEISQTDVNDSYE